MSVQYSAAWAFRGKHPKWEVQPCISIRKGSARFPLKHILPNTTSSGGQPYPTRHRQCKPRQHTHIVFWCAYEGSIICNKPATKQTIHDTTLALTSLEQCETLAPRGYGIVYMTNSMLTIGCVSIYFIPADVSSVGRTYAVPNCHSHDMHPKLVLTSLRWTSWPGSVCPSSDVPNCPEMRRWSAHAHIETRSACSH